MKPNVHRDDRGFVVKRWNAVAFAELGLPNFVPDNHSRSTYGTLRGLHFLAPPRAQAKLVSAVVGRVFDAAVDLRSASPTYGRWAGIVLDGDDPAWLWVPPGFANGFLTLSEDAEVLYKASDAYAPEAEGGLAWDGPEVAIARPFEPGRAPT